jgi:holo-[acyl-carrier protein] synthase
MVEQEHRTTGADRRADPGVGIGLEPPERLSRCFRIADDGPAARDANIRETPNSRTAEAGVDLVDLDRLAVAIRRSGDGFVRRVLTEQERELVGADPGRAHLGQFASLFGAKECAVKALHGLPRGASLHDISVPAVPRAGHEPVELALRGAVRDWATGRGLHMLVSATPITDRVVLTWLLALPAPGTGSAIATARFGSRS